MTGPEHYREAERLLGEAEKVLEKAKGWRARAALGAMEDIHRRARVHATLAVACGGFSETGKRLAQGGAQ